VNKAIATLQALWQTFRWWSVPILLLAGLLALARKVSKELLDTWAKAIATWGWTTGGKIWPPGSGAAPAPTNALC
jgi:hypothetical protein